MNIKLFENFLPENNEVNRIYNDIYEIFFDVLDEYNGSLTFELFDNYRGGRKIGSKINVDLDYMDLYNVYEDGKSIIEYMRAIGDIHIKISNCLKKVELLRSKEFTIKIEVDNDVLLLIYLDKINN